MKHHLTIVLPEELADLPIHIVKESGAKQRIVLNLHSETANVSFVNSVIQSYALVWKQNSYVKVAFDDILWVKAERSYSVIRLVQKSEVIVSSNLAVIEKVLPAPDFVRIHRSYIVNLRHVESLVGNSLKVEKSLLTIGREYRERVLGRFVFIGVRRTKK